MGHLKWAAYLLNRRAAEILINPHNWGMVLFVCLLFWVLETKPRPCTSWGTSLLLSHTQALFQFVHFILLSSRGIGGPFICFCKSLENNQQTEDNNLRITQLDIHGSYVICIAIRVKHTGVHCFLMKTVLLNYCFCWKRSKYPTPNPRCVWLPAWGWQYLEAFCN